MVVDIEMQKVRQKCLESCFQINGCSEHHLKKRSVQTKHIVNFLRCLNAPDVPSFFVKSRQNEHHSRLGSRVLFRGLNLRVFNKARAAQRARVAYLSHVAIIVVIVIAVDVGGGLMCLFQVSSNITNLWHQ